MCSCVLEQETAGAIGVLGQPFRETQLAEKGRLLITGNTHNRDSLQPLHTLNVSIVLAGGSHLGQQAGGDPEQAEKVLIPVTGMNVEELGS